MTIIEVKGNLGVLIAPIEEKTALEFGFPYNLKTSFASVFSSHLKMLKKSGME